MTEKQIDTFLKLQPKLLITHNEMSILSKKSPNDAVNKFKLKFINSMLKEANAILGSRYKPFQDFELFDEDELPFNSDVVFMLSPYLRGLEKLRCDNIEDEGFGNWFWTTDGSTITNKKTTRPTIQ